MSSTTRRRLAEIVRDPATDLAEAALLCCAEVQPELDVDAELLRIDAYADRMRSGGFRPGSARANAEALGAFLAGDLGLHGDTDTYHNPRNALLTEVLDRRKGLPITLAITYIAVARRLGVPAFGLDTPGHFLTAVGSTTRHPSADVVVIDPYHGGAILSRDEVDARIRRATSGLASLEPELLRPASPAAIIHRLLNNLTRDFLADGDAENALWTVELKRLLPTSSISDIETQVELLTHLGRYLDAAAVASDALRDAPEDAAEGLTRLHNHARAKMN